MYICDTLLFFQSVYFWPRDTLKGPKRSFVDRKLFSKVLKEAVLLFFFLESSSKNLTNALELKVTKNVREHKMLQREEKMFGKENYFKLN